jgi:DNA gyrase subunit A
LPPQEKITAILSLNKEKIKNAKYLVMATKNGLVKRTPIEEYRNLRRNGLLAINLIKDDRLEGVSYTTGNDDLLLITKLGQSIRFKETDIRPTGRVTAGVSGIKLKKSDEVVLMAAFDPKETDYQVLTVSANAYGKRTKIKEYRRQKRGGSGVKTFKVTPKTGEVVSGWLFKEAETLIAISLKGQSLKLEINNIPLLSRLTQGVRLMRLEANDRLAGITLL